MPLTDISRIASTTGDTWTDLVTGPAVVDGVIIANTGPGTATVSVRIVKGSANAVIQPPHLMEYGAAGKLRVPPIALETGNRLQVRSSAPVDWTASGTTQA